MSQGSPTSDDHAVLIQAIAHRRDRAAFAALFRVFAPRVKAWMIRGGANDTAAEELAQETMLAVWQKAAQLDPGRAGGFHLDLHHRPQPACRCAAARTSSGHAAARSRRHGRPGAGGSRRGHVGAEARIRAALAGLPLDQAAVIRKAFFEDKAHAEIEQELQIPLGTVKSRLRLAMNRLRAALGDLS